MPTVLCTGKGYAFQCLVDQEDLDWVVSQGNWFITHALQAKRKSGYAARSLRLEDGRWGLLWMHKAICERAHGPPPTPAHVIADHRNGIRLDNRRLNLRWATHQMNARNIYGMIDRQGDLFL